MIVVRKIELSKEEANTINEFIKLKNKFSSLCCDNGEKPCNCDFCPFHFCCHDSTIINEKSFIRCLENIM